MALITNDFSDRVKPTFASSSTVGLCVRANGEEKVSVIDTEGHMVPASIPVPTAPPSLVATSSLSGAMTNGKYVGYVYVYVAGSRYPNVENALAMGGSVAPRGNQSPFNTIIVPAQKGIKVGISSPDLTKRPDLTAAWVFRTQYFDTAADAEIAAEAGDAYWVGEILVPPATSTGTSLYFDDLDLAPSADQIELDNFGAPACFQFVHYADPYWWGWGSFPIQGVASWTNVGVLTWADADFEWYSGRSLQTIRLNIPVTVTVPGYDGNFYLRYTDATHGQICLDIAGTIPAHFSTGGSASVTLQGLSTTLFRSKYRNPFSWGATTLAGDVRIAAPFFFKIGGGIGTGITSIPNLPYLFLSTEFPTGSYTLDLRSAGTDAFNSTLRQISDQYSVTSHWSQFPATRSDGSVVLWGLDCKNYCIIESDGTRVVPISQNVGRTLRTLIGDRSRQLLAHGAYDSQAQLNVVWFPTSNSLALVNYAVIQHVPTGNWHVINDKDVLCSAVVEDANNNLRRTFVGTETGLMGSAFVEGKFVDWLPGSYTERAFGHVTGGDYTHITLDRSDSDLPPDILGLIGNWVLLTDSNDYHEQWARIIGFSGHSLHVDAVYSWQGGLSNGFNPLPVAGNIWRIGLIECSILKYFDLNAPATDKTLQEIWLTLDGIDSTIRGTFLRHYHGLNVVPTTRPDGTKNIPLLPTKLDDGVSITPHWFTQTPPSEREKTFGIEIIDRGYGPWRLFNWLMKLGKS